MTDPGHVHADPGQANADPGQANAGPDQANAGPDQANARTAETVAAVSHELRSPLTSLRGYTSLLLTRWDALDDEHKRLMLEQIDQDAERVTRLMTELLDVARLEAGRLQLRRRRVDLAAMATEVAAAVGRRFPGAEIAVRFPPVWPLILADPDKIEQVLVNLAENACKYGALQGITIQGEAAAAEVVVAVSDAGAGFPAEELPAVFTRWFRRAGSTPSGCGLGLWLARELVKAHGGHLSVESVAGHGATFRVRLPLGDDGEPASEPAPANGFAPRPRA